MPAALRLATPVSRLVVRPSTACFRFPGRPVRWATSASAPIESVKHAAKGDTAWVIGSLAVFAPTFLYLTMASSGSSHSHPSSHQTAPHLPSVDPENEEHMSSLTTAGGVTGEAASGRPHGTGDSGLLERHVNQGDEETHDKSSKQTVSTNQESRGQSLEKFTKAQGSADEVDPKKLVAEARVSQEDKKN